MLIWFRYKIVDFIKGSFQCVEWFVIGYKLILIFVLILKYTNNQLDSIKLYFIEGRLLE